MNDFSGIEKFSLVDYEGKLACTLFYGGCNFRCHFCHNSSLVKNTSPKIDDNEIFDYLTKRKKMLDGVCITGGEPTLAPSLFDNIEKIKNLGYSVKLDTNGTSPEKLKELVNRGLIDYVAMDIKNCKEKYALTSGIEHINIQSINESVEFLLTGKIDYEFRTTLVSEFHNENDIDKIGKWIKGAKKMYLQHFVSNENCINPNLNEVSKDEALEFSKILENYVDLVKLRGY